MEVLESRDQVLVNLTIPGAEERTLVVQKLQAVTLSAQLCQPEESVTCVTPFASRVGYKRNMIFMMTIVIITTLAAWKAAREDWG